MVKLSYLKNVHSCNYIHHDIKPANILTGTQDSPNTVYLADFSIVKQYHHPNMHIHILFCDGIPLTGTPAFASINSHLGAELSQWDDIKSLAYVLIYFLWGSLPWSGTSDVDRILQLKQRLAQITCVLSCQMASNLFLSMLMRLHSLKGQTMICSNPTSTMFVQHYQVLTILFLIGTTTISFHLPPLLPGHPKWMCPISQANYVCNSWPCANNYKSVRISSLNLI